MAFLNSIEGGGGKAVSPLFLLRLSAENWQIILSLLRQQRPEIPSSFSYGEGEETHPIDLCDKCRQYIKTVDYRNLQESDPVLEDLIASGASK